MTPWDFTKSISNTKDDIYQEDRDYDPFIINRALSSEMDCLFWVQEINRRPWMPKRMQYDYLLNTIRKRSRYLKWVKPMKHEYISTVQQYYQCSYPKALEAISVLSVSQLEELKQRLETGGWEKT